MSQRSLPADALWQSGDTDGSDSDAVWQSGGSEAAPPCHEEAWIAAVRMLGFGIVIAAFAHSIANAAASAPGWSTVPGASVFHHDTAVVAVLDRPGPPRRLLESLRMSGVRRVDLIVAADGNAGDAHAVLALLERYRGAAVVAPPMHRVPRARTVAAGAVVNLGALGVLVVADDPRLEVRIGSGPMKPGTQWSAMERSCASGPSGCGERVNG